MSVKRCLAFVYFCCLKDQYAFVHQSTLTAISYKVQKIYFLKYSQIHHCVVDAGVNWRCL